MSSASYYWPVGNDLRYFWQARFVDRFAGIAFSGRSDPEFRAAFISACSTFVPYCVLGRSTATPTLLCSSVAHDRADFLLGRKLKR